MGWAIKFVADREESLHGEATATFTDEKLGEFVFTQHIYADENGVAVFKDNANRAKDRWATTQVEQPTVADAIQAAFNV